MAKKTKAKKPKLAMQEIIMAKMPESAPSKKSGKSKKGSKKC